MVLKISKDLTVEYTDRNKRKRPGGNLADSHSFVPQARCVIRSRYLVNRVYAPAKFEYNVVVDHFPEIPGERDL